MMGLYYMSYVHIIIPIWKVYLKYYLQAGIDPNVLDRDGSNILHKMDHNYSLDIHQIICKIGIDPNMLNIYGYSPFMWLLGSRIMLD